MGKYWYKYGCTFIFLIALISTFKAPDIHAQFYNGSQLEFGKRKVQYNNFIWSYYQYDRYDIYFYQNGQNLAKFANTMLQNELEDYEDFFNTKLQQKSQFIIYNTLEDLKQSNLGTLSDSYYNTGGITHIIDNKAFVYFNGDIVDFQKQLRATTCKLVLQHAITNGKITKEIQESSSYNESDWFIDGLVSYCSEDWSTEIDDEFKMIFIEKKVKNIKHVQYEDAIIVGHSIWKFIADKYGEDAIKDIVRAAKTVSNKYDSFNKVIGLDYKDLNKKWKEYYTEYYSAYMNVEYHPENQILTNKHKKHLSFDNVNISPNKKHVTYTTNEKGLKKIYLKNLDDGSIDRIYKTGYRSDAKYDNTFPVFAWHPNSNILAVALEEKGGVKMFFYDLTKDKKKNLLFLQNRQFSSLGFQKILGMSYSPDAKYLILSAVKNGQSDLFLWNIVSGIATQLTNDIFNDFDPVFINDKGDIIFSSNRGNNENNLKKNNNLFLINAYNKDNVVRMTDSDFANEVKPRKINDTRFAFTSDKNGIYNLYLAEIDSIISFVDTVTHYNYFLRTKSISDYKTNIIDYDVNGDKIVEIIKFKNKDYINLRSDEQLSDYTPIKTAENLDATLYRQQQIRKDSINQTKELLQVDDYPRFYNVLTKDLDKTLPTKINIYNIEADTTEILQYQVEQENIFQEDSVADKWKVYQPEFFINELITQLDFSSMNYSYQQFSGGSSPIYLYSGLNVLVGTGLTDLMEDYHISASFNISSDLTNNEYAIKISNLKKRVDKEFIFHRYTDVEYDNTTVSKQRTHEFLYKLTYPFTDYLYAGGSILLRNNKIYNIDLTDITSIAKPVANKSWVGLKGELTFDNTYSLGKNLLLGTRFKIFAEYDQMITKEHKNLIVTGFDFRNYQRIHRQMIFAWRIAGSSSFGTDRLIYYMGGVDKWILPRYNSDTQVDPDINYAYQTLATNMRGFSQNTRNGPNFIVLNAELRVPVIRYLFNRPLSSNFFNSIQLIGFTDIGTAWNGLTPYSKDNNLYIERYYNSPLYIEVTTQTEPFIMGYGVGARASILGYFIRVDYGWGLENWSIADQGWHFSLSLDF